MSLKIKDEVLRLLVKLPHLRDSDSKLIANIWHKQTRATTAQELLKEIAEGKLPSADSITRCRRKAQEEFVELRGHSYNQRQGSQEAIKTELKLFTL